MTAAVIPFPRPHLRLVEAVREAQYVVALNDGYSPKVLPIPKQRGERINCVKPVEVVTSSRREWL